MSRTWSPGYLGALEWMLGWQTSSTVERVHAAVGRCGAQRVLGRRRARRQARNGRGHWAQALLPLGQRNQWSWEESRDWFLLQGSVHQMHGLRGNQHSIKQEIRLCLWPRQTGYKMVNRRHSGCIRECSRWWRWKLTTANSSLSRCPSLSMSLRSHTWTAARQQHTFVTADGMRKD